ncbi:hypothetical protein [Dysosmobacter sp.]|uniref:hypothetical protein n=1 Tax=Dysosmobacter sp. TaxID=2591382 RepID=UPI003AAD0F12
MAIYPKNEWHAARIFRAACLLYPDHQFRKSRSTFRTGAACGELAGYRAVCDGFTDGGVGGKSSKSVL